MLPVKRYKLQVSPVVLMVTCPSSPDACRDQPGKNPVTLKPETLKPVTLKPETLKPVTCNPSLRAGQA